MKDLVNEKKLMRNKFKESPFFILKEPFSSLVNVLEPMSDEYILQAKKDIEDLFYKYKAISVKINGKHQQGEYVSSEIPDGKRGKLMAHLGGKSNLINYRCFTIRHKLLK